MSDVTAGATGGRARPSLGRRHFLAGLGATVAGGAMWRAGAEVAQEPAEPEPVLPVEQPEEPSQGSHRIIWSVDTDQPVVALTFDDGPDPRLTPEILEVLAAHGARATFFMMGHNAVTHRALARSVVDAGHEVANHGATHLNHLRVTGDVVRREIELGTEQVESVTGVDCRWFRPPRGQLTGWSVRYAAMAGQDTVMWSRTPGNAATVDEVVARLADVAPGEVVLLHDGIGRGTFEPDAPFARRLLTRRRREVDALPTFLERAAARGVRFVRVGELVAAERVAAPAPV